MQRLRGARTLPQLRMLLEDLRDADVLKRVAHVLEGRAQRPGAA